jgi:hypothetical protein
MSEPILQAMEKLQRELEETKSELAESQKDFLCLATLLDGHDATECRMNLVEIIQQRDRLAEVYDALLLDHKMLSRKYHELELQFAEAVKQRRELKNWKESAIAIEKEWDVQRVAEILEIPLWKSIRANIEPRISKIIEQRDHLEKALRDTDTLLEYAENTLHGDGSDDVTVARMVIASALKKITAKEQPQE